MVPPNATALGPGGRPAMMNTGGPGGHPNVMSAHPGGGGGRPLMTAASGAPRMVSSAQNTRPIQPALAQNPAGVSTGTSLYPLSTCPLPSPLLPPSPSLSLTSAQNARPIQPALAQSPAGVSAQNCDFV